MQHFLYVWDANFMYLFGAFVIYFVVSAILIQWDLVKNKAVETARRHAW